MSEEISFGAMLREARERRGETLEQAHQQTAISPVLLQELESGEFRVEPVYARLAAANYASYLGLDSEEITARFDLQFGRPDFPSPSRVYLGNFGPPNFLSPALNSILNRRTPPFWKIGAAAAATALAVLLAILLSGEPEEPSPPPVEAAEVAPLQEESKPAETALQERPVTAAEDEEAVTDLASPLVLRAEAVDSIWVRIQRDGEDGVTEEIIPMGESRQWEAATHFTVWSGPSRGVRFFLQGRLLGNGSLGDPDKVLRFRAAAEEVVLLGADLTPLSAPRDSTANPGGPPSP